MKKISYFQIVRCLMYLIVNTYFNISFVMGSIVQFMTNLNMFY